MKHILLSVIFALSFLHIDFVDSGSIIMLDIVAIAYFAASPKKLINRSRTLFIFGGLVLGGFISLIISGSNELPFVARLLLIVVDALFLLDISGNTDKTRTLSGKLDPTLIAAGSAYLMCYGSWLLADELLADAFFFGNTKAWIATFPGIFAAAFLISARRKMALFAAVAAAGLALFDGNASRALILQALFLGMYALWQINRAMAKLTIVVLSFASVASLTLMQTLVEQHDHSNTFRMVMMMQVFDFSGLEWMFGRGIIGWRLNALNALYDLPGAIEFFETANPHFFPAEVLIRGGITMAVGTFFVFFTLLRRTTMLPIVIAMLVATFFTTNTGVERLYMSLALYVGMRYKAPRFSTAMHALRQ